jgi:CRP-like cAMP-binding protein
MRKMHVNSDSDISPKQNFILSQLPVGDLDRLAPDLKLVDMHRGWTISEAGDHVDFVHFPVSGIVSLMYSLEDGSTSETALVGKEGIVGISIFMGGDSMPASTEVQSPGKAYRLPRSVMKREFNTGGKLQQLSLLFTQALITQTAQTAVCNQYHGVDQQMCRWLLTSIDRLDSNELLVTQEQVSNLLGVRRETISKNLTVLQKRGLIETRRGRITVLDRNVLEKCACECYTVVKDEYARLFASN